MPSREKILFSLVLIGAFWNVAISARGLQPVQAVQPVQRVQAANPNNGFALQSGYEGYLLSPQQDSNAVTWSEFGKALAKILFLKGSKSLLLPFSTFIFLHGLKIFKGLTRIMGLLAIGTLLAIPICTFTSLCTISLPSSTFFKANAVKDQLTELTRAYMSPEKLEMATQFLKSALETYGSTSQKLIDQPSEPAAVDLQSPSDAEPSEQPDEQLNEAHLD